MLRDLFALYSADAQLLPPEFACQADPSRAVADYMAGMTDRHALREHQRLTGKQLF